MTVTNTGTYASYTGDSSTVAFAVEDGSGNGFYFFDQDDLIVKTNGVLQVLNVDYSVTGEGTTSGVVTFFAPPLSGRSVTIQRATDRLQNSAFTQSGPFPSESIEKGLDRTILITQELRSAVDRALLVELGSLGGVVTPGAEGEVPLWGPDGGLTAGGPDADSIADAEANAEAAAASAAAAAASALAAATSAASYANYRGYRRKVVANIPINPSSYASVVSTNAYRSIVPQGFCIDEVGNRLFVLAGVEDNSPSTKLNSNDWVYVFDYTLSDMSDLTFNRMFGIDAGTASFSEGIVFLDVGGTEYLYTARDGSVRRYDITTLPADESINLAAETTYSGLDAYSQISYRHGEFLLQIGTRPIGQQIRRGYFAYHDANFSARTGHVYMQPQDVGPWVDSDYEDFFPKIQATVLGDNQIVCGVGGLHFEGGTEINYGLQGVKIFELGGKLVDEWLVSPELMIDVLEANSIPCTRMENEGILIREDGTIMSLYTVLSPFADTVEAATGGIVIFEELSNQASALDMSTAARNYKRVDMDAIARQGLPRFDDEVHNPVTGAQFTTLLEITDFLRALDIRYTYFYTAGVPNIDDFNGDTLPAASRIDITMNDNASCDVVVSGFQNRWSFRATAIDTVSPVTFKENQVNWRNGTPEGVVVGNQGDVYWRMDGASTSNDFLMYNKTNVANNGTSTGWVNMTG